MALVSADTKPDESTPDVTSTPPITKPSTHWTGSGHDRLDVDERGWLVATDDYFRLLLSRPELALVDESCVGETALHHALVDDPKRTVLPRQLTSIRDVDARENYRHLLRFRDGLLAAGSLEGWYLQTLRAGVVDLPPLFLQWVVQACLLQVLGGFAQDVAGARIARAAELLFRPQRIHTQDGQVLSGDQAVLDMLNETGGLGDMGRLLAQNKMPLPTVNVEVLSDDNAHRYWQHIDRHRFVLDLTHNVSNELSHGLVLSLTRAQSGLTALARVLEAWVMHFLGVKVTIKPEPKIDDANWRWHVGLDADSSSLLNDLYLDRPVEPERMQRLLSLFRLTFQDPREMRDDVAGKPVYLALSMTADKLVKLKPQNLLLNLPLRTSQ